MKKLTNKQIDRAICKKIWKWEGMCPTKSFHGYPVSTRVDLAFQLVEKLREQMIAISVVQVYDMSKKSWEYVAQAEFFVQDRFEMARDANAAKAICLVALKTI